jgi:acyl-CoA synthetase (AMP-forming)/AMP-acid ligase II
MDGGWQPTGHLGFFDACGAAHFLGRRDLMIKTGSENVSLDEFETVMLDTSWGRGHGRPEPARRTPRPAVGGAGGARSARLASRLDPRSARR